MSDAKQVSFEITPNISAWFWRDTTGAIHYTVYGKGEGNVAWKGEGTCTKWPESREDAIRMTYRGNPGETKSEKSQEIQPAFQFENFYHCGVIHCARCGEDHAHVKFKRFVRPVLDSDGTAWEWWATCPNTGDPILGLGFNDD